MWAIWAISKSVFAVSAKNSKLAGYLGKTGGNRMIALEAPGRCVIPLSVISKRVDWQKLSRMHWAGQDNRPVLYLHCGLTSVARGKGGAQDKRWVNLLRC